MQEIVEIGRATQDELRDDLRELFQGAIRLTLEMVLEEELKAMVGARRFERVGSRKDHRNGTYLRRLLTSLGQIEVAMPRSRDNGSPADVIGRYQRRSPELDEMMVEAYVSGVSQRKMGDVTEALMGERVGRSTVSRVAKRLDEAVEGLRRAPIEGPHPYLYLDATFLDARWARKVENVSALVAYAVGPEGHRRLLAVTLGAEESQQSWSELLEQLQDRGLGGVELVIADEHAGLAAAVRRFLPEARRQRCTVHLQRNVGARVPHRLRKRVAREVSVIFQTSGLAEAKKLLGEFGARWKKELPEAVEVLERGFGAATQFYAFPEAHWPRLRTTNSLERLHGEIKRRIKGRRRLPGPGQRPQAHHGRRTQDHTRLGRPALPRPLTPPETGGRPSSLAEGEELPPLLHTNRDLTHRTLKREATRPPKANLRAQQRHFNDFRRTFNQIRPHEALDDATPDSAYRSALRAYPDILPPIEYPEHFEVRKVSTNGGIRWHSGWINISSALGNEFIGLEPIGPALWQVYFGPTTLGWFDEELFVIFDTHGNTGRNPIC